MSFRQKIPPTQDTELFEYLSDLENRIMDAFRTGEFEIINLAQLNAALDKPRSGDLLHADGTNYNPGAGEGVYYFNGSTYTKL